MKKELIRAIALSLVSYGYTVYLSKDSRYGFYTDGARVVCFGGTWEWLVDFSGNYISRRCGTGWQIAKEKTSITADEAAAYISESAPRWATSGEHVTLTTPAQHLATYGKSSGYTLFTAYS